MPPFELGGFRNPRALAEMQPDASDAVLRTPMQDRSGALTLSIACRGRCGARMGDPDWSFWEAVDSRRSFERVPSVDCFH
jgi:hypothetical protein